MWLSEAVGEMENDSSMNSEIQFHKVKGNRDGMLMSHTRTHSESRVVVAKPLIPVLGRQRQADFCEFEASLVYKS